MAEEYITLVSEEGENFVVKPEFKNLSLTVKNTIESVGSNAPITFNKISSATFKLMIEWTEHHDYNPAPLEEEEDRPIYPKNYALKNKIIIADWDKDFLDKAGLKAALDLVQAANTLEYTTLYKNCIRFLALQIKGKTAAEVGELFKPAMQAYGYFLDEPAAEATSKKIKIDDGAGPSGSAAACSS